MQGVSQLCVIRRNGVLGVERTLPVNLHLCVRRSGVLGVEMKTLPVKRSQPANQAPTYRWYPCARVRPCVPCVSCVSRLPPVSFYRYSTGTRYKYGTVHGTLAKGCIPWIYCGIRSGFSRSPVARS